MCDCTDHVDPDAIPVVTTLELLDGIARFVLYAKQRAQDTGDRELEGKASQAYWWTFDATNRLREWGV